MTNETLSINAVSVSSSPPWRLALWVAATLVLWTLVAYQFVVSLPICLAAGQNFGLKFPWHMELLGAVPGWFVVVPAVLVSLIAFMSRKPWGRVAGLVALPAVINLAILLSINGAYAKLAWGLLH